MNKKDILVLLVWAFFTVLISSSVDAEYHSYLASHKVYDVPVVWQILGEGRSIVSNLSILQADLYFHGGAGHFYEEHQHGLALAGAGKGEEDEEHHAEKAVAPVSPFNVLFRISRAIGLTEHKHLHGADVKEIIPWLYYAAKLDPNNIQAYTLTAFWLGDRLGKVEEAVAFLKEGLSNNPDSWEINAELGRIYCQHIKDHAAAKRYLLRAKELISSAPHDRFQERYVLSWLAETDEALGDRIDALPIYERIKVLFPGTTVYEERIKTIEDEATQGAGGKGQGAGNSGPEGMAD